MTAEADDLRKAAWIRRYRQRIIDRSGMTPTQADACAMAVSFAELSDGFKDDPEGAADMEMSYWEP